jgi:hypothetical protein
MPDIDEDVMRELMFRSTADLHARPRATAVALKRQRQHRTRARVLGVTGIAAAAGLAAGVLAIPSGAHTAVNPGAGATQTAQLTAAQQTLYGLSAAAAGTHRPAGRYVVMSEKSVDTAPTSQGPFSESGPKTSVIDTVTGGGVEYQAITVRGATGSGAKRTGQPPAVLKSAPGSSPTTKQLDAMPTSPAQLRAFLLNQAKTQLNQAYAEQAVQAKKAGKKIATPFPKGPQPTDNDLVFEQATDLLWEPHVSPALRAALYKVLADTPGVKVRTGATDSAGRPAVEISRVDQVAKANVETFENPKTGATLESAWLEPTGEFLEDLYLSITYTNHIPANPYQG